jgi:CRISPR-associated protein Cas6
MFWQDDQQSRQFEVPADVVDVLFSIDCRELPVDHAHDLSEAIVRAAPWIADEPSIGIHAVHVAGSQNGWERPEHGKENRLLLSRRTKLTIRVPKGAVPRLQESLRGAVLDVGGCRMVVGEAKTRLLSRQGTVFARYVVAESADETDEAFLVRTAAQLREMGIRVRRALCGKTYRLSTPEGAVATRSLMLADLSPEQSVTLQERGLGPLRRMGCGIFIPHKGIDAVKGAEDD